MKQAGRSGADYTVIIGDNELAAGAVEVKSMAEGSQEKFLLK